MKRPKRYQSGGVFDINPEIPSVGRIAPSPTVNTPQVTPASLPDLLSLVQDSETRRYREEQRILREQQLLNADQDQFFALRDGLFGEIHNPQQQRVLEKVKKEYGISDKIDWDLDNPYQLKAQIKAYQMAASDPRAKKVLGQVEAANKFREIAARPGSMTSDEILEYNKRWNEYSTYEGDTPYDVNQLFPSAVNKPKVPNQTDFAVTTRATMANNLDLDVTKDQDKAILFDNVANAWYQRNAQGAIDLGYIKIDPTTQFPVLTPLGQQTALNQYQGVQGTYLRKQEDAISQYTKKKVIAEGFEDDTSGGTTKTELKKEEAYRSAWKTWLTLYPEYANLDPDDENVRNFFLSAVDEGGLTAAKERRKQLRKDLNSLLPPQTATHPELEAEERRRALERASQQVPQATTVAPVSTKTKRYNPVTGRFE